MPDIILTVILVGISFLSLVVTFSDGFNKKMIILGGCMLILSTPFWYWGYLYCSTPWEQYDVRYLEIEQRGQTIIAVDIKALKVINVLQIESRIPKEKEVVIVKQNKHKAYYWLFPVNYQSPEYSLGVKPDENP